MASTRNNQQLEDLARLMNPVVRGWMNYYRRFYRSKCVQVLRHINEALASWARRKCKRFKRRERASMHWLGSIARRDPNLFVLWQLGVRPGLEGRSRMRREFHVRFCEGGRVRFPSATRLIVHCRSEAEARTVLEAIRGRLAECGLELHSTKTKIVYCKDDDRPGKHDQIKFDFLG